MVLKIKNNGNSKAELLVVKPNENISIESCGSCTIKALKPKEVKESKLNICKTNNSSNSFSITIKAINSTAIELKIK